MMVGSSDYENFPPLEHIRAIGAIQEIAAFLINKEIKVEQLKDVQENHTYKNCMLIKEIIKKNPFIVEISNFSTLNLRTLSEVTTKITLKEGDEFFKKVKDSTRQLLMKEPSRELEVIGVPTNAIEAIDIYASHKRIKEDHRETDALLASTKIDNSEELCNCILL